MAWIGYNPSGYAELESEIKSRKAALIDILDTFSEVYDAIDNCWKGEDATAYNEELRSVIESTKSTVSEAYDVLSKQCQLTYSDWENKQSVN